MANIVGFSCRRHAPVVSHDRQAELEAWIRHEVRTYCRRVAGVDRGRHPCEQDVVEVNLLRSRAVGAVDEDFGSVIGEIPIRADVVGLNERPSVGSGWGVSICRTVPDKKAF